MLKPAIETDNPSIIPIYLRAFSDILMYKISSRGLYLIFPDNRKYTEYIRRTKNNDEKVFINPTVEGCAMQIANAALAHFYTGDIDDIQELAYIRFLTMIERSIAKAGGKNHSITPEDHIDNNIKFGSSYEYFNKHCSLDAMIWELNTNTD
jgi:hypothetical protein